MSMYLLGDDPVRRIRFEHLDHQLSVDEGLRQTKHHWKETDLFPAVRTSNIRLIVDCVKKQNIDINAVDFLERNALQAALNQGLLSIEACRVLIQLGIDLNCPDMEGHTALAKVVFFYKDISMSEESNSLNLELFRLMAENGANLHVTCKLGLETVDIWEKIKSHPEMEGIVQMLPSLYVQRARKVYEVLKGDYHITQLVCKMIGFDPGRFWEPPVCADPICADPNPRNYSAPVPCTRITPPI